MDDLNVLIGSVGLRRLLEGSHVYGDAATFRYWYERRFPIVAAVDRPGSILDIGCANGFLLRSLSAWSKHDLVPYGVDPDPEAVEVCKQLFPELEHFATLSVAQLGELSEVSLPASYTYVYWNVWDDFEFTDPRFDGYLGEVFAAVEDGGRLILGFYDLDRARSEAKITWLSENFLPLQGCKDNTPHEEIFVWWDK